MSHALHMSARFRLTADHLVLAYEVVNPDTRDAYLLNRLYRQVPDWEMGPDVVYVHLDPTTETVWLNKKLADLPEGVAIYSPVAPFVTPLRAGSSFREEVKVPLPVRDYRQYGRGLSDDDLTLVPRRYRQVWFTLGYYWAPEGTVEETHAIHGSEVVVPQAPPDRPVEFGLLQTDPVRLDLPVLEPAAGRVEGPTR
jgi:hypothetical protein